MGKLVLSEPCPGWVYVLSNRYLPGLYKIGSTSKMPEVRAGELYTTGLPGPFELELKCYMMNYKYVEQQLHLILDSYRCNPDREYFKTPLSVIEKLISENMVIKNNQLYHFSTEIITYQNESINKPIIYWYADRIENVLSYEETELLLHRCLDDTFLDYGSHDDYINSLFTWEEIKELIEQLLPGTKLLINNRPVIIKKYNIEPAIMSLPNKSEHFILFEQRNSEAVLFDDLNKNLSFKVKFLPEIESNEEIQENEEAYKFINRFIRYAGLEDFSDPDFYKAIIKRMQKEEDYIYY